MAQKRIEEFSDYPKWVTFFRRWEHISNYGIAKLAHDEFGDKTATWQSRIDFIRDAIAKERKKNIIEENEKDFFTEILHRPFPYAIPKSIKSKSPDTSKIVVISDPHEPYSLPEIWEHAWKNHKNAQHIHINGDLIDLYSQSRFVKNQGHENLDDEMVSLFNRLEWLSIRFHRVTIIAGNHDNRIEKRMANCLPSELLWLSKRSILKHCASYFDNVEIVGQPVKDHGKRIEVNFIWQYGDMVFTHIERSQKQSSALLENIASALIEWSDTLQLNPFRCVVQGHNHRLDISRQGGKTLILLPMAADITGRGLQYILNPRLQGRAPVVGYAVIHHDNGKFNYNETRTIVLENQP